MREDRHDSGNNAKVSGGTNENSVKFLHVCYYQVITRFYLEQVGINQDSLSFYIHIELTLGARAIWSAFK